MSDDAWGQAAAVVRQQLDAGERPRGPAVKELYALATAKAWLYKAARNLGADAEDLAHDVLASRLEEVVRAQKPGAYFYTVFIRRVQDELDKIGVRMRAAPTLKREADERHRRLHELQEAETGVVITEVADLLATLTPREREVVLAVASGERPEDLAVHLKTSRANIDQIVSRARRTLRMRRDEGNDR